MTGKNTKNTINTAEGAEELEVSEGEYFKGQEDVEEQAEDEGQGNKADAISTQKRYTIWYHRLSHRIRSTLALLWNSGILFA